MVWFLLHVQYPTNDQTLFMFTTECNVTYSLFSCIYIYRLNKYNNLHPYTGTFMKRAFFMFYSC